ncbi:hypothetical protein BJ138DRAFT_1065884 [Hygrophoropsis aurantiaca]|uniref:Uncharacterized protein n=1 Tax=Hygrophoropsis aurantiaca TaxID=72124 RepID=A0ACB8ABJ9_9AGAM|nr:hypothetical protein BJ138DRAFT_1065884 [Hygrophoropsis aurantiaca]
MARFTAILGIVSSSQESILSCIFKAYHLHYSPGIISFDSEKSRTRCRKQNIHKHGASLIRAQGLQYLRPEKLPWRPIVNLVVDEHPSQCHELSLGCDGQNPNLKQPFILKDITGNSRIMISVFHQSASKKKGRNRNLVATASGPFSGLLKLQGSDSKFEVRLHCTTRQQRGSSRGKAGSATLFAELQASEVLSLSRQSTPEFDEMQSDRDISEDGLSDTSGSDSTDLCSPSPMEIINISRPDIATDNVRIRGYWSDSDDDSSPHETDPLLLDLSKPESDDYYCANDTNVDASSTSSVRIKSFMTWVAASLLPTHTGVVSNQPMSRLESFINSFSSYGELHDAADESDYARVLSKLQAEWYYVGASLIALAGLYAAVFSISSSGALPGVDNIATRSIAVGSISSGIGITIDAWFTLAYSGADASKFQKLALDVFGTYKFFCITARLPALCMFVSACALMIFLLVVAWSAWPTAVLVMCIVSGVVVTLQFIVYGACCVFSCIFEIARRIKRAILWCFVSVHTKQPSES